MGQEKVSKFVGSIMLEEKQTNIFEKYNEQWNRVKNLKSSNK